MKKLILFLTALFLITGCSSDDSNNGGDNNPIVPVIRPSRGVIPPSYMPIQP